MTIDPSNVGGSPLVTRVKNIILQPKAEWERIETETADMRSLYVGYVVPLAAIAAVCATIGLLLFSWGMGGFFIRLNPLQAVISGLFQFVMAVACVYAMGFIINILAPSFGAQQNELQAHKVAVYGSTAGLLAGVFSIHPLLAILGLVGLYSFVLLWFGLERLMKAPEDKRVIYYAAVIGIAIVAGFVISLVLGVVRASMLGTVGGMPPF